MSFNPYHHQKGHLGRRVTVADLYQQDIKELAPRIDTNVEIAAGQMDNILRLVREDHKRYRGSIGPLQRARDALVDGGHTHIQAAWETILQELGNVDDEDLQDEIGGYHELMEEIVSVGHDGDYRHEQQLPADFYDHLGRDLFEHLSEASSLEFETQSIMGGGVDVADIQSEIEQSWRDQGIDPHPNNERLGEESKITESVLNGLQHVWHKDVAKAFELAKSDALKALEAVRDPEERQRLMLADGKLEEEVTVYDNSRNFVKMLQTASANRVFQKNLYNTRTSRPMGYVRTSRPIKLVRSF
jgi:hypothetical protein